MKVAILTPTMNQFSGIDHVVWQQAHEMEKKGHKVVIITLEAKMRSPHLHIVSLGMPKSAFWQRLYRLFFFVEPIINREVKLLANYDKVIAHQYPMTIIGSRLKKKHNVRYIYWDHGINVKGPFESILQKWYMKLFLYCANKSLKNVDNAYSVSKYLQKELWKQSKILSTLRYNIIDKKKFNKKIKGTAIRKKYNLKKQKVLLFVGRIAPHKGVHILLKSFKRVKQAIPNAQLLIVGKPTFSEYYKKLKKDLVPGVQFTGEVSDHDLPKYYAACDLYVTASLWEGFDLPAAEAQACGKPVVGFGIGSHPEVIKKGTVVKEKTEKALTKAIIKQLKKR